MILVTIETVLNSAVNIVLFALSETDPNDLRPWGWVWGRDPQRIHSCLEWLNRRATPEGFVPGVFSIMDLKLMCTLSALSSMTSENWEQYENLAALHDFHSTRPSIVKTDPERQ